MQNLWRCLVADSTLNIIAADDFQRQRPEPVDAQTMAQAAAIVDDVRRRGIAGLQEAVSRFEGRDGDPLLIDRAELKTAFERLEPEVRRLLERTKRRIAGFASAQRACLSPLDVAIPGGRAGHDLRPVQRVGCYAPGGNYPLPSSVLMTAVTAKVAGVQSVIVATPSNDDLMLGAAWVADADAVLWAGGAHAISALVHGIDGLEPVDFIVGPGNRWVTAAKALVTGRVGIDMLAGPSELVVAADSDANPQTIAADLLGQAEHDVDAVPILITDSVALAEAVVDACESQLADLPTGAIAKEAIRNGAAVVCSSREQMVDMVNRCAPEHLEIQCCEPDAFLAEVQHYGGAFVGDGTAEVFGDYGVGPNHVLPTGGTARYTGGLSVLSFIRVRTWIRMDNLSDASEVISDTVAMARQEGLEGHARSAEARTG